MNPYIVIAFFAIGYISGYYVRDLEADREKLIIEQKNVQKLVKAKKKADELEQELIDARKNRKVIYRTVVRKIHDTLPQKQTTDSICNITDATLRLLNSIRMSKPAEESFATSRNAAADNKQ